MSKNINISSGSDFSKKKFGAISKLTKPAFVHNGKIFSDHIFNNTTILPLIENNFYYTGHGLPDLGQIYELIPFGSSSIEAQFNNIVSLLSLYGYSSSAEYLSNRSDISATNAIISSIDGASIGSPISIDPYLDNGDQCPAP